MEPKRRPRRRSRKQRIDDARWQVYRDAIHGNEEDRHRLLTLMRGGELPFAPKGKTSVKTEPSESLDSDAWTSVSYGGYESQSEDIASWSLEGSEESQSDGDISFTESPIHETLDAMLRFHQSMSAESARSYYGAGLTRGDYYSEGQEVVGAWGGKGAARLGLSGTVDPQAFNRLIDNQHPLTGDRLTARHRSVRTVGYDLNFHAPKSVSVLMAMGGDERIVEAFRTSVAETMEAIEANMECRVRKGGVHENRPTGNLVWGEFVHFTARPVEGMPDPHLHAHCFTFNATYDGVENAWKAGQFRNAKKDAPFYQGVFHMRFARRMQELGYGVKRTRTGWEIEGVPQSVVDTFSKRTKLIEKLAAEKGITNERFKSELGARSREKKVPTVTRGQLVDHWDGQLSDADRESLFEVIQAAALNRQAMEDPAGLFPHPPGGSPPTPGHPGRSLDDPDDLMGVPDGTGGPGRPQSGSGGAAVAPGGTGGPGRFPGGPGGWEEQLEAANAAVEQAIATCFERQSVVDERVLQAKAMSYAVGRCDLAALDAVLERDDLARGSHLGRTYYTPKSVWLEEQRMIGVAQKGKNACDPIGSWVDSGGRPWEIQDQRLNLQQRAAIDHVLSCTDRVMMIEGAAGVGKTSLMNEAITAMRACGKEVYCFAPTAAASRGTLEAEGHAGANTVANLLSNTQTKLNVHGQVIWIDEAGMLSVPDMKAVLEMADRRNCRVILAGDTDQHHSVQRGDAMHILKEHAQIVPAEVKEILRQEGAYKAAVAAIKDHDATTAFEILDKDLGAVIEIDDESRHQQLVQDYMELRHNGKSVAVVSPTHAEKDRVTEGIREGLKETGHLGEGVPKEQLRNLHWTEAERKDAVMYEAGQVLVFHQNMAGGFQAGQSYEVLNAWEHDVDPGPDAILTQDSEGAQKVLPLDQAERFGVYERREIELAEGDRIRITKNAKTVQGRQIMNGQQYDVKDITEDGAVKLSNGQTLAPDFEHIDHGYCTTSHASQSTTVDAVLVAEGSESLAAAGMEQFYVSVSRGREEVRIYTDNADALQSTIEESERRLSATDLAGSADGPNAFEQARDLAFETERFQEVSREHVHRVSDMVPHRDHGLDTRDLQPATLERNDPEMDWEMDR